jgi:hypothetical protein
MYEIFVAINNVLGLLCFICFLPLIAVALWSLAFDPVLPPSESDKGKSLHDTWEMDTIRFHPEDRE